MGFYKKSLKYDPIGFYRAIYFSKRNGRPKDRYDAQLIENLVDVEKLNELEKENLLSIEERKIIDKGTFYDLCKELNNVRNK